MVSFGADFRHTYKLQQRLQQLLYTDFSSTPSVQGFHKDRLGFRAVIAKVRYCKDPHMQNSMRKLKLTLTLTLTLTDTGGAVLTLMLGYRS